ncbi:Uridine nucleosidase 1 [Tulasnella sp. JGI-2019a]|nr:Uridine nucleosidase 1 [Tulasnella sp. JGI-2019a]KAG9017343.1 Uridine nucleosidase 1 [Tulasnella sp. JGI-2019a]KAG9034078.1 Uridine nucleosidase 1 [Tulasnella sp. JGI-2019a]
MSVKPIWLDSDPGHDDAIAILLACSLPSVRLLGLSTVHGNASAACTYLNGVRLLECFAASADIDVWPGADHPLIRPTRADPEIHGIDGLAGGEGLPSPSDAGVQARMRKSSELKLKAIQAMANAITETWNGGQGEKVTLIATGPLTNVALFFSVYPELVDAIEEVVMMGGGVGLGNRSSSSEFNILCDPEAAQIVLDVPIRKVMIPLNVTHTALLTRERHCHLLDPRIEWADRKQLPPASSPLRNTLSSLLSFFSESYRTTFGFVDGPPLHDALTVAYVVRPDLFISTRFRVDVELGTSLTMGETVLDLYEYGKYDESWGRKGKNCIVVQSGIISEVFDLIFEAIDICDKRRARVCDS